MNTQNIKEILVDAKQLLISLKLASMAVIEKKEVLNQINFFPVTDKDTGENLAVTLQTVHEIPISVESCDEVLQRVSQSIFEHARGNSGVIFSIWFSGLERTKHSSVTYSWVQIKQIFHASTVYLCEQMEQVVPGTMVSLLEQFAKILLDVKAQNEVPQQLRALLEATRYENQVLASHGVVDAGALGVTIFLEHFFESLFKQAAGEPLVDGHTKAFETDDPIQPEYKHSHEISQKPTYRYCTEVYLKLEAKDKANALMPALKNKVASLGDCDLLALRGEQIHIHVHTNEPVRLFKALAVLGKISRPKVEDMLRQYQAFHSQKSIALVTDASADIDERILEQNQIHLIPLPMTFDGHEALDPYTVDKTTFYSQLEHFEQPPKTASPNLEKARSLLTHLSTHYKKVLVITISSKMSATYQSLSQLAQSMREVSVFDSLTNSGAHGFVVTKAAELIDKKYDLEHIVEQLTHYRQKVSMLVAINSVSAILASGRVSGLKGELLKRVNPKLIISINKSGKGIIYKKFFLKKDIFNELLNIVTQKYRKKAFKRYCVLYVSDKQQAESFANKLSQLIGVKPSFISCVSSAVGIHAGKEGLAVAYEQG